MDRWPDHQPAPEWRIMEHDQVINAIILRAGSPDIDLINSTLASVRKKFSSLKEQAVSLLSAAQIENNDPFIERKLKQIDKLAVATPGTIANSLGSSGQNWSKDLNCCDARPPSCTTSISDWTSFVSNCGREWP